MKSGDRSRVSACQIEHAVPQVPDKSPASQKSHPFPGRQSEKSENPSESVAQGSDESDQGIRATGSCRRPHRDDRPGQAPQLQTEVSADGQGPGVTGAHKTDAMSFFWFHLVPSNVSCFALGTDASIFPASLTLVFGTRAASTTYSSV